MSMLARASLVLLVALCCLQLTGCGGGPGTFDPVQHDMDVIFSDADLETRRKASRNLIGQNFTDQQIDKLMEFAKNDNNDNVIRSRIIQAFGTLDPQQGNRLLPDLVEIGNRAPSGSGLRQAVAQATDRLSWKSD